MFCLVPTAIIPAGLAAHFNLVIDGLYRFVAAHGGLHRNRRDVPLVVMLCNYLRRVTRRFAALVARGGAPARARAPGPRQPAETPPSPRLRFPHGMAWLLPIVPLVGNFGGQLQVILASEEFAALLAAGPAAGRLMRPLCRMLGIGPGQFNQPPPLALFQPPARPAKPRQKTANAPAADAQPGCPLPSDAPQAGASISDPPPGFRPKQA